MNISNLMITFVAVVKAGSFTKAAELLSVSKSVVSKHISELEHELKVNLIYRNTRGIKLTEYGESFYPHCQKMSDNIDLAINSIANNKQEISGRLNITMPEGLLKSEFIEILAEFQQVYPKIKVMAQVTGNVLDLVEQGIDMAFRVGILKDSELICKKLKDCFFQVVANQTYLDTHKAIHCPEDLSQHNCLIYNEGTIKTHWGLRDKNGRRNMIRVDGNLYSSSAEMLLNATIKGQGLMFGPSLLFENLIEQGKLVSVLQPKYLIDNGVYLLYPKGAMRSARAKLLLDFMVERLT
ncbi:MAG: LysR family transcriptional regulator [Saccharospirillaceae bacterium]|nr:LysR family transcriptional regulator [Pseudomonadales bacterium]NRB80919.1 LysR family transcriptional regulator [Saccharospirillaceae bacterium]